MKKAPDPAPAPQREGLPMQVDVKIHSLHASGPVLADASVNLNGCFAIRGVKVVEGSSGPFVSMPSYKGRDGYKDICFPCTKEFHQQFHQAVLDSYQQSLVQLPHQRQSGMGQEEAPPAPEMRI
ncbi:SpoVG family protein [uncultured Oscillibacter sp.]|jgi:stage V sporulation protein G|uniref:SpoVG family protein n=1 Tax=uncultured Oscillibacter sp. TaxID=876091 RepID=UPI002622C6C8|nr:SpoVG family protein [uncultured Oscillibacter sp.]